jgi:RNA polymerase sigma factor (TIGR02999 family)
VTDVTRLLEAANCGDKQAAAELLPLVYDELRKLAAARMAAEAPDHTLQPTALVHEGYLRLVGDQRFDGRGHFFAAAAEAMRRILVDAARRRDAGKRGGDRERVAFVPDEIAVPERADELLAVSDALDGLAAVDPQAAELVKLRYFAGLSVDEAAAALGTSTRTAERLWVYARTWLRRAIDGPDPTGGKK